MKLFRSILKLLPVAVVVAVATMPSAARACAACYGQSDSPLADGINWGIMTLLLVVVAVLGGFVAMFTYFARRAAAMANHTEPKASINI